VEVDQSLFTKEVMVPFSGQRFIIRRVRLKDFMIEIGGLSLPTSQATQEAVADFMEKAKSDPHAEDKALRFYISRGAVSPKVWFGNEGECPADQIYYENLGSDLDALAMEIMKYSYGMAINQLEHFFFQGTGSGNPGLDGAEIRPTTVEPTA